MRLQSLNSQHQRISDLIKATEGIGAEKFELQSQWARYVCVLCSGFMENAIKEIYSEYARRCSNDNVASYVSKSLDRIRNPNAEMFLQTANAFQQQWKTNLEAFIAENGRKDALDSIMANRHLIVHGRECGISVVRIKEYLGRSVEVLNFIEGQCEL